MFVFPGGCREDQWGSLCGLWDHPVFLGVAAHQSGGVVLPSPAAQSEPGESLILSHSSKSVHQYHSWTLTRWWELAIGFLSPSGELFSCQIELITQTSAPLKTTSHAAVLVTYLPVCVGPVIPFYLYCVYLVSTDTGWHDQQSQL